MLAVLLTRRWIGFTALVLGAIIGFGLLSHWQWSRAEQRQLEAAALDRASSTTTRELTQPITADDSTRWARARVVGAYAEASQVLLRQRPLDGRNGFWVLTRMDTEAGSLWVVRGWMPATQAATAVVTAPAPPTGEVEVVGYVDVAGEPGWVDPAELPRGQVTAIDLVGLDAGDTDTKAIAGGYLVLESSTPVQDGGLVAIPRPTVDAGRNLSYAVQWGLFALVAAGGWGFLLRRESREVAPEHEPVP